MTNQELDDFLAMAMGWKAEERRVCIGSVNEEVVPVWVYHGYNDGNVVCPKIDWHPHDNIAQAIQVAEKVAIARGGTWTMFGAPHRSEPYSAWFSRPYIIALGDTLPRALSLATAKALGAEV